MIGINATFSLETAFGSKIYSCLFEKFVLLCGDSLDRIELVAPLFLLRLYWFLLIFAKTLARSKTIMIATLFPSPSFLYLCRFLGIFVREDFVHDLLGIGYVTQGNFGNFLRNVDNV